jgi:hypothetical protein
LKLKKKKIEAAIFVEEIWLLHKSVKTSKEKIEAAIYFVSE